MIHNNGHKKKQLEIIIQRGFSEFVLGIDLWIRRPKR